MPFIAVEGSTATRSLSLGVERPLPAHAFPDEFVECTLRLQHGDDITFPLPFQVALVHADTKLTEESSSHLVIDPATPLVFTSAICTFRFHLRHVVQNMCLRCSLAAPHPMVSVLTSPITIVQEKLVVTEQPPDVWFKDEGGRDKCMTIQVQVEAAPGHTVSQRIIPLELTLLYDSGDVVQTSAVATSPSTGILKLFPDLRPNITNGHVSISFRIEDVSKNHQNHSFVLQIAPESSNVYADISSVRTAPVAIRSKRNKRRLGLKSPSNNTASSPSEVTSGAQRPRALPTPVHHSTPTHACSNDKTPMNRRHTTATPHNLPRARPTWTDTMQEWKLVGYEIHEHDGSMNKQAPIYRCLACLALTDVSQQASHAPTCVYFRQQQQHPSYHQLPQHASSSTSRPHSHYRVQTPQMVYGYNHVAYTPTGPSPPSMAGTPGGQHAGTPYAQHQTGQHQSYMKPSSTPSHQLDNIFLSTKAPTPSSSSMLSPESADALAKPMLMMDMYMSAQGGPNGLQHSTTTPSNNSSNWNMMQQQMGSTPSNHASAGGSSVANAGYNPEVCVAFILAAMSTDMRGDKLGLPAFDQYHQLIGFYKEQSSQPAQQAQQPHPSRTQVVFYPVSDFPLCNASGIAATFESAIHYGSLDVFALSKYMGNLSKMQEEAFLHYWSQNLMQ
ncbi:hypothetical protein, variant [Aphanomyces invadans]|uniref:Uncharacterized protein n=1 Tax=Aphanomyces invadans TaxID=157072 RepID=A0A024UAZ2_9STRA|nr:hypothetical protein, variant [Aphanomyces invadans]ETW02798.1 hypothetical protein, variant [Aphanomyces invadans]|eukprot:XP_008868182.1 hypothetical protein, variant [Aphanomyces invadans]